MMRSGTLLRLASLLLRILGHTVSPSSSSSPSHPDGSASRTSDEFLTESSNHRSTSHSRITAPPLLQTSKNWGVKALPGGKGHWVLTDHAETDIIRHNLTDPSEVGITTHFWLEAGRGSVGRYHCDTMIIRVFVDNEPNASLVFTPSMAAGSGVGLESQAYYSADQHATPRGSSQCKGGQGDQCGMDLLDGWPWQNRWTGKGGSEGNWILHVRIPFTQSLRITAQIASGAAHIDPRFARADIPAGTTAASYFMIRGLEGAEEQIRIALGDGALMLPPLRTHSVRLHMQQLTNHTPLHDEFVPFVSFRGGDEGTRPLSTSGAMLMLTVSLQGMHTVDGDVEMCWWALTSAAASYNSSSDAGRWLIGTGMEDFFANSFTLSRLTRTYANDDVGLTHIHGGPQDMCPNPGYTNYTTCNAQFQTQPPERFSAYRFFDKDPLVFDDRLELSVRYLPRSKCSLAPSVAPDAAKVEALPTAARRTRFDSYAWFYTFDRGEVVE